MNLARLVSFLLFALGPIGVRGFDTGHHWEATSQALRELGFSDDARQTACVSNWMLDYYSSSPTGSKQIRNELSKLHCDNFYDAKAGLHYLVQFDLNAKRELLQLVESDAPDREIMMLLGVVLHVVQDLYSHSNWPENFSSSKTVSNCTWYSNRGQLPRNFLTGLYHPPDYIEGAPPHNHPMHGSYHDGIHKDSHERHYWAQAYFLAYCATYEFMSSFRDWIPEDRWARLTSMNLAPGARFELNGDMKAAYGISLWIDVGGEHGHWKGGESGHKAMFVKSAVSFITRSSRNARWYRIKKGYRPLLDGLYDLEKPLATRSPQAKGLNLQRRVVMLEVTSVREIGRSLDQGIYGKPDLYLSGGAYYGIPTPKSGRRVLKPVREPDPPLEGEILCLFRDRVIQESAEVDSEWRLLLMADPEKLAQHDHVTTLYLEVGDEDPGPDNQADVSPDPDRKGLVFTYHWPTGQVSLPDSNHTVPSGRGKLITLVGNDAASVELNFEMYSIPRESPFNRLVGRKFTGKCDCKLAVSE